VPDTQIFTVSADPEAPIQIRNNGWCPDWPSGGAWFPPLFESNGIANFSGFAEPAIDAEIDRIRELPFQEQPAEWGVLDRTIMTAYYPTFIIGYPGVAQLHGPRIGGLNIDSLGGMPTWKDMHVLP